MARLNEPPVESVESLKRRFVRQNRELARNNSTQSVKIRSLETQVSQLVAENVALRANIIQLQNDLDGRKDQGAASHVDAVRKKLEDKLHELQGLVAELGLHNQDARPRRDRSSLGPQKRSPAAQRFWSEHRAGVADVFGDREGFMPTIAEGKQFPRRTLDTSELHALISNQSSDSPDIGPPPRTSVDSPDRPSQATLPEKERSSEDNGLSALFSVNLETRRKRRETSVRRDTNSSTTGDQATSPSKEQGKFVDLWAAQPVRAGSKRKLDAAYRPAGDENSVSKSKDDLTLKSSTVVDDSKTVSPSRRVLAPKSVNTDPVVSPKKPLAQDKPVDPPSATAKLNPRATHKRRSSQHHVQQFEPADIAHEGGTSPIQCKIEPKTPAPLDLFSPGSTEHSEARPEGRGDTPPPSELSMRSATGRAEESAAGRGSRRARAGVNYAEPNLISKMRRPSKNLVDAVAYNKNRSSTTPASEAKVKQEDPNEDQQGDDTATFIKRDQAKETAVNNLGKSSNTSGEPQSPLVNKEENSGEVASLDKLPNRRRDRSTLHQPHAHNGNSDSKEAAVSLQDARSKDVRLKDSSIQEGKRAAERPPSSSSTREKDELDIFDVGPSPPRRAFTVAKPKSDTADQDKRSLSATSSARSSSGPNPSSKPRNVSNATASISASASASAVNAPRSRRQTLGARVGADREGKPAPPNQAPVQRPRAARSSASLVTGGVDDKLGDQTAESKAAGRRRSMMV